jgi:hypothetical protein
MAAADDDDEDEDDIDVAVADPRPAGGSGPLLIYRRSDTVVARYSPRGKKDAHACVGTMLVEGHTFDTFERLDNCVALRPGHYVCKMEFSPRKFWPPGSGKKRKQLRPLAHGVLKKGGRLAAILLHPGSYPLSFIGCIGVGRARGNELKDTGHCMDRILELCGGFKEGRKVHLTVIGEKPPTP